MIRLLPFLLLGTLARSSEIFSSGPLFLWSNQGIVGAGGAGGQVIYNVLENVQDATARAILGLLGKVELDSESLVSLKRAGIDSAATVNQATEKMSIVIFAGSQMSSADLRQGKAAKLSAVLDAAASSLVLPFSSSKSKSVAKSVQSTLEAAGLTVQAVGCNSQPVADLAAAVTGALTSSSGSPLSQVVVVCPRVDLASNAQTGLDQELEQLITVQEALDASELKHLTVYISQSQEAVEQQRRRSLLSSSTSAATGGRVVPGPLKGFGPYTTCGTLCQTQVRWLEGMLSILFLALASCAGLTCLNVLNTPTRFEVATE